MDIAIILIVLLAVGFLVAVRIVGINKGEKNPEEDDVGDRVLKRYVFYVDTGNTGDLSSEAKARIEKIRSKYKNKEVDFNSNLIGTCDHIDDEKGKN